MGLGEWITNRRGFVGFGRPELRRFAILVVLVALWGYFQAYPANNFVTYTYMMNEYRDPLADILLDQIRPLVILGGSIWQSALTGADVCCYLLISVGALMSLWNPKTRQFLQETLCIGLVANMFRMLAIVVTNVPDSHGDCYPLVALPSFVTGSWMFTTVRSNACGDMVISGHTLNATMGAGLVWISGWEIMDTYSEWGKRAVFIWQLVYKTFALSFLSLTIVFLFVSLSHYTSDILLGSSYGLIALYFSDFRTLLFRILAWVARVITLTADEKEHDTSIQPASKTPMRYSGSNRPSLSMATTTKQDDRVHQLNQLSQNAIGPESEFKELDTSSVSIQSKSKKKYTSKGKLREEEAEQIELRTATYAIDEEDN